MAGLTDLQRLGAQSIQSTIEELQESPQSQQQQQQNAQVAMTGDMTVLGTEGPSYMQVAGALDEMRKLVEANTGEKDLSLLHSLANTTKAGPTNNNAASYAAKYGRDSATSFFNPLSYQAVNVNQKQGQGGQGGYGSGGRTGAGNVATGGIDRMLEMILAQSLNRNGMNVNYAQLRQDMVTLLLRTPETEANGFHELTGALVMLLADQMNRSAENAAEPSPELRDLISKLTALQGAGAAISQPHMQALMDEISVMVIMEGSDESGTIVNAQNPMAGTIMQLMQNMLGLQNGATPNSAQMRQLLDALMKNLQNQSGNGDTMKAALLMEQLLPDLMGMIDGETGFVPGAVIPKHGRSNQKGRSVRLPSFSMKIDSNGDLKSDMLDGESKSSLKSEENGSVSLLDASDQTELAGGIKIDGAFIKNNDGKQKLKTGTFSWNGGNDSVVMNSQGEAVVSNDAGKTWVPLPKSGVSTYNPGNGGPNITYNPQTKTITFSAGDGSHKVLGSMYADNDGVNIDMTSTDELHASGQIASVLSPES
jgi:hypothetical protein